MATVLELNLGLLEPIGGPQGTSGCRSLLIDTDDGFALVDSGFGLAEMQYPMEVFVAETVRKIGIQSEPELCALLQIRKLGLERGDIRHIICTHLDIDHAGGLADFPHASVHVASREYESLMQKNPRYYAH